MLTLPEEHRKLFKDPFGELYREMTDIIPLISKKTVYSVGDVVTHNLQKAGITPDVAIIDGYTMRTPCSRLPAVPGESRQVKNPAGTLTEELMTAIRHAVIHPPCTIIVDGEEDLAVIPMVIAAPLGSIVIYGQPGEGVVLRTVTPDAQETAREYLKRFIRTGN